MKFIELALIALPAIMIICIVINNLHGQDSEKK